MGITNIELLTENDEVCIQKTRPPGLKAYAYCSYCDHFVKNDGVCKKEKE